MSSVKTTTKISLTDPQGKDSAMGPWTKSIASLTEQVVKDYSIATAATQTLWDHNTDGGEVMAAFSQCSIVSDQAVHVEIIVDDAGVNGKVIFTIQPVVNVPLSFTQSAYSNPGADDATSGTLVAAGVDRIRVNNVSGSTANVRFIMVG